MGLEEDEEVNRTPNEEILLKQLADLRQRSDELVAEIERLRAEAKKREHDTTDMVNMLESQVKSMDKENKTLASELKMLTLKQISDKKGMKRHFEITLKQAERVFLEKESGLLDSNKNLLQEVTDLTQFKKVRGELARELEATKETITLNEERHKDQLKELERKFYEARGRLEREAEARIAHSRQVYKEEVGKELDMDSKRIRRQNRNMEKELKFQIDTSGRLSTENDSMKGEIKKLRMELHQVGYRDDESALKGLRQATQIKEHQEKIKTLETSLKQVVEESQVERSTSDHVHANKMASVRKQSKDLMHTITVKLNEIRGIKSHARTILMQRNQIEKLFLRALDMTKEQVLRNRHQAYKQQQKLYNEALQAMNRVRDDGSYPDTNELGPPPEPPKRRLGMSDLTQEDRDQGLRLLVEWVRRDPEACAIMGEPFTSQNEFGGSQSRSSLGHSQNLPDLGGSREHSRPGTGGALVPVEAAGGLAGTLTFLTDPSTTFEERERELETIM